MASFKDLLKELNVRYENDVATLTAQCHRLIQENQRLKGNEERELTVEVQQEDAETMDKENENADAVGPTRTQRQALSGITGSMHFGSKKTVLPKTQSAILVNSRLVRVLSTGLDWWSSLEEPKRSGIIYKIVESKCFWCISILVILINAVSITSITDISLAEDWGGGIPTALINVEIACLTFYLLELVLRLAVHRVYFFVNENSGWNWLDLLLVAFSIVEIAVLWGTDGESGTVLYMRTLRICKVSKAVRIFRVLTAFREAWLACLHYTVGGRKVLAC
ncbi:CACNA1G [Symbiodinium pilosum]|uniref:CACNA1G protein n=1 Tax=Symbiodinium pilosum TaxID=2952 RepID=A0A812JTP0_SYMPI|nr:CACNA1G [Symbiodinium pilosum]